MNIPGEEIVKQVGNIARQRASRFSISLGVCFITFAISAGGFVWSTKDAWLENKRLSLDTAHLEKEHHECQQKLAEFAARIQQLEQKVHELELRQVAKK